MKVEKQFCTPGTKRGLTCLSCHNNHTPGSIITIVKPSVTCYDCYG